MLKFNSWFIKNRPNSRFVDSFRKVKGHLKKVDSYSWRTPLDRDPVITRRVKAQYKLMRANSQTLTGNVPYYVVYGLIQKRDLFTGIKLSRPILEVGYSTSPKSMKFIVTRHRVSLVASIKKKSNVYFRIAYFNSLKKEGVISSNEKFDDYFEAVPIDIAATESQGRDLERFYTIYLNRVNGRLAYDLNGYNTLFNAIVGGKNDPRRLRVVVEEIRRVSVEPNEAKFFLFVSKEHLDSAIRLGLEKSDLQWYFREASSAIEKILSYYYPGRDWKSVRRDILTEYLTQLAESGIQTQDLSNYFYRTRQSALEVRDSYKDRSFQVELIPYTRRGVEGLLSRTIGSFSEYNRILFESYLKPHLLSMAAEGFITKEKLIEVIKGASQLPYLDSSAGAGLLSGDAFRWIFQLLYTPDIMAVLSRKNYGNRVKVELTRDLGLTIEGDRGFNNHMVRRLEVIINNMFGTTDLSQIYRMLNSGNL